MGKRLRKLDDEEWKFIPDSDEKYMVSNYGRVKSFVFKKTEGQIMKPAKVGNFLALKISVNKKMVSWYIHKLVATVFIPNSNEELTHVVHADLNYMNNRVSNLVWVKKEKVHENERLRNSLSSKRRKPSNTRLKERDVAHLKTMLQRGFTQAEIAKLFCISEMQVTRIKRGENWGHVKPSED